MAAPANAKVLLLSDHVASRPKCVPPHYVRPPSERPNLLEVEASSSSSAGRGIPLIDLKDLAGPRRRRRQVVKAIASACETDGFFQVKNHGVPADVIEAMLRVAKEFFHLPEPERLKSYSEDTTKTTRLSTSFNVKAEKVSSWRDFLRLSCHPIEDCIHEWPSNPSNFKEVVAVYSKHVRELALRLLEAISESLGLERDYMVKALGKQGQHMVINYYPPCPQPDLTYGLPGHKDPNAITLLLQDGISGLQVFRDGKWVLVTPLPHTLVINIGDQIQVLSNDRYKSVLHRAIVNSVSERISIPTFYCPSFDVVIKPAEALVDEKRPPVYRSFTYGEYFGAFWDSGLRKESNLDMFRILNNKL